MIQNNVPCPRCGSFAACEIIWGYPSPEQITKVEFGKAVLGGPNPYRHAPTLFCRECGHRWAPDNEYPVAQPVPDTCHYCDAQLTQADRLRFAMAVAEFYEAMAPADRAPRPDATLHFESGLFALYPLPVCKACREEINARELDKEEDTRQAEQLARTTRRLALWLIIIGLLTYILITWFTEL